MKLVCLSCGHKIDLGDAYDNYAGQVKCWVCGVLLEIAAETGELRAVALAREVTRSATAAPPEAAR